jgi:small subunit ribosomal protein S20
VPSKKSAKKRLRQSEKRRVRNRSVKSQLKNISKKVMNSKDYSEANEMLSRAYKLYDMAVSKGVVHRNNAARHKSKLTKYVSSTFKPAGGTEKAEKDNQSGKSS